MKMKIYNMLSQIMNKIIPKKQMFDKNETTKYFMNKINKMSIQQIDFFLKYECNSIVERKIAQQILKVKTNY